MYHHREPERKVRSFLRQIAISLERLVLLFARRHGQSNVCIVTQGVHARHTHTQIHPHTDSCHASHAFHAHARPFTRARQFCHNGEKYAAETSVNPEKEGALARLDFTVATRNSRKKRRYFSRRAAFTRKCTRGWACARQTVRNVGRYNVAGIEWHSPVSSNRNLVRFLVLSRRGIVKGLLADIEWLLWLKRDFCLVKNGR